MYTPNYVQYDTVKDLARAEGALQPTKWDLQEYLSSVDTILRQLKPNSGSVN